MSKDPNSVREGKSLKEYYFRQKEKGLFNYIGRSLLIIFLLYSLFILIVYLISRYLLDFSSLFEAVLLRLEDWLVLVVFFISESFLGMVPVDLFVVWTQKFNSPLIYLALLGVLSYTGGIISYGIGRWISGRPRINAYSERNLGQYMDFTRKWGGAFIVIAALFPFTPFSMVVIALSLLKFPFKHFLYFALSRLVRFVIQGILMFQIFQLQNWIN